MTSGGKDEVETIPHSRLDDARVVREIHTLHKQGVEQIRAAGKLSDDRQRRGILESGDQKKEITHTRRYTKPISCTLPR